MNILRKINTFLHAPWTLGQKILEWTWWLWSDATYLRLYYCVCMRKPLRLKNPVLFTEKLQWLKLYNRKPEYTTMVDKITAKEYAANIIGEEYIIPTLQVYDSVDDINLNELPSEFVIKTSHGGGSCGVIVCQDKHELILDELKRKLREALKQDCYAHTREWPYKNVKRRILAEQIIQSKDGSELFDYKFFCFNGIPLYCQVIRDRNSTETIDFYDTEWNHQDFVGLNPAARNGLTPVARPDDLNEMLDICRKLSRNIPFVRIDLYNVDGRIYFGEITFYPRTGIGAFAPAEWDKTLGDMLQLPPRKV